MSQNLLASSDYFNVRKLTLLSFNPEKTAKFLLEVFKGDIEKKYIPEKAIRDNGVKWVIFPKTGLMIHLVPPTAFPHLNKKNFLKLFKEIIEKEKTTPIWNNAINANHMSINVPDLTPIVNRISKLDVIVDLKYKVDGIYQLYFNLPDCLDYFEIDSTKYDDKKGYLPISHFPDNYLPLDPHGIYSDPNSPSDYLKISLTDKDHISIECKNTFKKKWNVKGTFKNKKGIIDFSTKPNDNLGLIKVKFIDDKMIFPNGDVWNKIK